MAGPEHTHLRFRAFTMLRVLLGALSLLALAVFAAAPPAQAAAPAWTTYHHDAERTGNDPDGTSPLAPTVDWHSVDLGAPIWNQPLILGPRVYVATVGNGVYALDAATGAIVWHVSAGTPVPAADLPCGDVKPTVGIVGTPVIDQAAGVLYAVADTWDGTAAHHLLEGFRLSDGAVVLSTPVDPPGAEPTAILQRTALNLDGSNVIFGFGGNDGDCATYTGAVVSVPESGAAPSYWQVPIDSSTSSGGGAVWATGGPAVNAAGQIFASTGNPNPESEQEASTFDDSDAVVSLTPMLGLSGAFEPPTWVSDSNNDRDLGSGAPELLPGGLIFEAGKNGTGYLLEQSMSGVVKAVYEGEVCAGAGSFGGDSYAAGVIYIPCTNGTQALAYDSVARSFAPLWKGPPDAFGPPILSAGSVWLLGGPRSAGSKLYALDPTSGDVRYTETLPSAAADHFGSPSAAGGRIFLATGSTVTAYEDAALTEPAPVPPPGEDPPAPPAEEPRSHPSAPGTATTLAGTPTGTAAPATLANAAVPPPVAHAPLLGLMRRALHVGAKGKVRLVLRCPSSLSCHGGVSMRALIHLRRSAESSDTRLVHVQIAHGRFHARSDRFVVVVHLDEHALAMLRRHHGRLHVTVTLELSHVSLRKVDALLFG
jgi:outer membrane protein assembly factor BamB